jgi:hypothetical protein
VDQAVSCRFKRKPEMVPQLTHETTHEIAIEEDRHQVTHNPRPQRVHDFNGIVLVDLLDKHIQSWEGAFAGHLTVRE